MSTEAEPPAKKIKPNEEIKFNMSRVKHLHGVRDAAMSVSGVAYYMHRDQRVQDNWAMIYAQSLAMRHGAPLHVVTLITTVHPVEHGATLRHLKFCFDGLKEVSEELAQLNIAFHLLIDQGVVGGRKIADWMKLCGVDCLVTDFSPLRQHRNLVKELMVSLPEDVSVYQVDAHNIIPVEVTSEKQEYAARTIRNKITSKLGKFLTEFPPVTRHPFSDASTICRQFADKSGSTKELEEDWESVLQSLNLDFSVKPSDLYQGGTKAGLACLKTFVRQRIKSYNDKRNDPTVDALSNLSPWFHMGNLSVQRAVLYVKKQASLHSASFIEESVVRRELSDNFCFYNPNYDSVKGASAWAQATLNAHRKDKREYVYTRKEFEDAKTHDNLWNAAQRQLVREGKMHGFMRMYWAKKILEWTKSPEEALEIALYLNDHFSLDGSDPNGFVGCMWSICGIHDQGWAERAVFGKIRFMNYNGCKRKFAIEEYIAKYSNFKDKK